MTPLRNARLDASAGVSVNCLPSISSSMLAASMPILSVRPSAPVSGQESCSRRSTRFSQVPRSARFAIRTRVCAGVF
jgi:hypothetical protein